MNFVENNGKKVAAVLCVASAFPVVATVVAAQEEPGWHGDKYINEDKTPATGWEEIEGESYYFSEDGTVDTTKTEKATTASVSSSVLGDVKETVATTTTEAVETEKETKAVEEAKAAEEATKVVAEIPVDTNTTTTTDEETTEDTTGTGSDALVPGTPSDAGDTLTPPADTDTGAGDVSGDSQNTGGDTSGEGAGQQQDTLNVPEQTTTEEITVTPVETPEATTTTDTTTVDTSLNDRIAAAAQQLVGVTNGQWCTQVVQQALANAGVSDAYQLWPDQYQVQYGYYTDTPQAGNLIYYNNGGRGVDHIAIYIGNGLAVHGNYNGQTVIADANGGNSGCVGQAQYIQVVR